MPEANSTYEKNIQVLDDSWLLNQNNEEDNESLAEEFEDKLAALIKQTIVHMKQAQMKSKKIKLI